MYIGIPFMDLNLYWKILIQHGERDARSNLVGAGG